MGRAGEAFTNPRKDGNTVPPEMGWGKSGHEKVGNDKAAAGSEARAAATYVENKSRSHGWKGKHEPQPMEKQGSRLKIKAGPRLRMKHELCLDL
ncbi:hypothetical protein E3N88_14821 [Mikania micrantha]|uniref:Uncharacterized protein n=1 Tax=Mikania micrantha TaxID=192012 RepID=A0A5N6P488_9ASTR|nr:hypothetical protein E3N88_14821 [Mikania micrantha]